MKFFLMTIAATFLLGQAQAHERGFFDDTFDMTFDLQKNAVQFVVKDKKGHLVIDGLEVLSGKCGGNLDCSGHRAFWSWVKSSLRKALRR